MFGKAKMNQDPKMNAVGVNDVSKLLEMKEQQMKLNDFNKDYCKSIITQFDDYKLELNQNSPLIDENINLKDDQISIEFNNNNQKIQMIT